MSIQHLQPARQTSIQKTEEETRVKEQRDHELSRISALHNRIADLKAKRNRKKRALKILTGPSKELWKESMAMLQYAELVTLPTCLLIPPTFATCAGGATIYLLVESIHHNYQIAQLNRAI